MNARELIESGLIESYCLGLASSEERVLVDHLAQTDSSVQDEIDAVLDALSQYASSGKVAPLPNVKERLLASISQEKLAPLLLPDASVEEWVEYVRQLNIQPPDGFREIVMVDLPGNEKCYTFAAWANQGDGIPEETHHDQHEFLFVCSGECEMTVDGKKTRYQRGGFIAIPLGSPHSAAVTGNEPMLIIVQRRAA